MLPRWLPGSSRGRQESCTYILHLLHRMSYSPHSLTTPPTDRSRLEAKLEDVRVKLVGLTNAQSAGVALNNG